MPSAAYVADADLERVTGLSLDWKTKLGFRKKMNLKCEVGLQFVECGLGKEFFEAQLL